MRNAIKSLFLVLGCLWASMAMAETLYVVSGKCNVPLKAGMSSAKYQIFTWDGTTATVTTAITCDVTGTAGSYYNSTSLALNDLKTLSNYGTSSTSSRTMQAIKLAGSKTMTISLGSKTFSKAIVVGRANSNDALSINILGQTQATNNKDFFVIEKEQTFSGSIQIQNTTSKEYNFFIYLVEGQGGTTPDPGKVTGITVENSPLNLVVGNTGSVSYNIQPTTATNKSVTWSSDNDNVASVNQGIVTAHAVGTAHITVTTVDGGFSATCTVIVSDGSTPPPTLSNDATLSSLTYGGTSVPNFSPNTTEYTIELTAGIKTPPTIDAVTNHANATKVITQAQSVPGSGNVVVTAEDGTTKLTYTVNYTTKTTVPTTSLTTHVPEIYEAKDIAGGYNTPLTVFGGREYEVFYINRDATGKLLTIATSNADKAGDISDDSKSTDKTTITKDGWAQISGSNGTGGDDNAVAKDEFAVSIRSVKFNSASHVLEMHVQGYDQFSFYGKDNNTNASKNKMFEVYIDDVKQSRTPSDYAINRYTMTAGEHVIRLTAIGGSDSKLCSFSLRVAQEPRTKYLKGNDSTQVVMQTAAIQPITYVTKYNNIPGAETKLEWIGQTATGITLQKIESELTDTLLVSGNANCATGVYNYAVVAYYNGTETSRATGKFTVKSDIQATSDVNVEVYQGEEMDQITFKYFALSANDVQLTWPNGQPSGITGSGNNGKYIIGGTPQNTGTFPFSITVTGADTIISGKITVNPLVYGENSVLYLYKNTLSYEQDAVYNYISSGNKWNLVARKAKEDGLRPANQYANYKWVLISEDADADNQEVLAVIRGGANLPVLNLKGFTYTVDRLNWGEPDNGAIDSTETKKKGTYLHVQHANHPIYTAKMNNLKTGDSIQILSDYMSNGIMPINVNVQGSLCLGTAFTRDIDNYFGAGELQTALHEVPAAMRGGHKYICLPIARKVTLAKPGKDLIDGIIAYLTSSNDSGIEAPELQINQFSIAGFDAEINQKDNTLLLRIPIEEYDNLETAQPIIKLANPNTHVTPSVEPSIDLRYAIYIPRTFVVSDYINRRAYDLTIETYDPQGIEEIYEAGMWINIFDIWGRKVATTNEDFRTMDLPQGMYIIGTESGKTLKIMK